MKGQQNLRTLIKILLVGWVSFLGFEAHSQCSQNNIVVAQYELRKSDGTPFSVTDNFQLGQDIQGQLWVTIGGSTTNGYNLFMTYDIHIENTSPLIGQTDCIFVHKKIVQNEPTYVRNITWKWGDVVQIKNIFMYWLTGNVPNNSPPPCQESVKSNQNAQCYTEVEGFTAVVPLYPKFDFNSNPICKTTVNFINQTIGGTPPYNYSYEWDFTNDGSIDAEEANPTYSFPSSGYHTVKLTVNDSTSITTVYKQIFIDPNFDIKVETLPTKADSLSPTGIIYVRSVTGGTPPYSYSWTGPDGFSSTNKDIFDLKSGTYELLITDKNGCTQRITENLDVATVLKFEWNGVEAASKDDEVKVTWVANSEIGGADYILERSIGNADNFIPVDSYLDVPDSDKPVRYELTDSTFPVFETKLYYRIIKRFGPLEYVSPVKLVVREAKAHFSWMAYPNPASGQPITLAYMGKELLRGEEVKMELFNSGNYYRQVVLSDFIQNKMVLQSLFGDVPKGILYLRVIRDKDVTMLKLINSY